MTSDIGSAGDKGLVCTVQISHIVCLQDQHHYPVDADHNRVQAERCSSVIVLAPDSMIVVVLIVIMRAVEGIENAHDDEEEPREDGEDLVG